MLINRAATINGIDRVTHEAWSADRSRIAVGGFVGRQPVFAYVEAATGSADHIFTLPWPVTEVAFAPGGATVAVACGQAGDWNFSGELCMFDVDSQKLVPVFAAPGRHAARVDSVEWVDADSVMVTFSPPTEPDDSVWVGSSVTVRRSASGEHEEPDWNGAVALDPDEEQIQVWMPTQWPPERSQVQYSYQVARRPSQVGPVAHLTGLIGGDMIIASGFDRVERWTAAGVLVWSQVVDGTAFRWFVDDEAAHAHTGHRPAVHVGARLPDSSTMLSALALTDGHLLAQRRVPEAVMIARRTDRTWLTVHCAHPRVEIADEQRSITEFAVYDDALVPIVEWSEVTAGRRYLRIVASGTERHLLWSGTIGGSVELIALNLDRPQPVLEPLVSYRSPTEVVDLDASVDVFVSGADRVVSAVTVRGRPPRLVCRSVVSGLVAWETETGGPITALADVGDSRTVLIVFADSGVARLDIADGSRAVCDVLATTMADGFVTAVAAVPTATDSDHCRIAVGDVNGCVHTVDLSELESG